MRAAIHLAGDLTMCCYDEFNLSYCIYGAVRGQGLIAPIYSILFYIVDFTTSANLRIGQSGECEASLVLSSSRLRCRAK